MNKTIITSLSIICLTIILTSFYFIKSNEKIKLAQEKTKQETEKAIISKTETRDRFIVCIDTVMTKSIEANKPIEANEAKDICLQIK